MTHLEIRRALLDYFIERDHKLVPSASLVPRDDPSLLFTTAGMVQFKSLYSTTGELPYRRAVSIQKCLRAGGKDSDLELVGRSPRHLTFFEMLGHFSFGDYFKAEAIEYAWDFFTRVLQVDPTRLYVSVFEDDEEAAANWLRVGMPRDQIVRLGVEDNFWGPAGGTGACGPCSEIYWDLGPELAGGEVGGGPGRDDRYIEVWNDVFPQFDQQSDGSRPELPNKGIDMGAGLERMAVMLQGKQNIFETDIFLPIMAGIRELADYDGPVEDEALVSLRRVADHARALTFTLAEGLVPSNVGRGYVLRRILRRAMMSLRNLGVREPLLYRVLGLVTEHMLPVYPELRDALDRSALLVKSEEERFLRTIEQGMSRFQDLLADAAASRVLSGKEVFRLYSTFGIPMELTREMAAEAGIGVDEAGYQAALAEDRRRSQEASSFEGNADAGLAEARYEALTDAVAASRFVGYGRTREESVRVLEWRALADGELELILDQSPFYATAGGQIADTGELILGSHRLAVLDVQRRGSRILHRVRLPESLDVATFLQLAKAKAKAKDGALAAQVDEPRRRAIARAHTGTHLLHAALHRVIGQDATQAGSWVGPDRLRFDFNHFRALDPEEIAQVEGLVTEWILDNRAVQTEVLPLEAALARGAMALFGEKYEESVRVVSVGDVSLELCGGTHLDSSAAIGSLIVTGEGSVASGVRRIEAVTGLEAQSLVAGQGRSLGALVQSLRVPEPELPQKVAELLDDRQKLRKELEACRASQAAARSDELLAPVQDCAGIRLMRGELQADGPKEIRSMADSLRGKLDQQVAVVLARAADKLSFLVLVPDALVKTGIHAGKLTAAAAADLGARGGGSPTLAQAGLKDAGQLAQVIASVQKVLTQRGEGDS